MPMNYKDYLFCWLLLFYNDSDPTGGYLALLEMTKIIQSNYPLPYQFFLILTTTKSRSWYLTLYLNPACYSVSYRFKTLNGPARVYVLL